MKARRDRWFEVVVVVEAFRREYNEVRPHSSLDYLTPSEFSQQFEINQDGRDSRRAWS